MSLQGHSDISVFTVDAFSSEPFQGNPAAVCLLDFTLDMSDATLQSIAAEMNLSETAYIQPLNADDNSFTTHDTFNLRWFTPTNEVPLCGHATLASAATLFLCANNSSPAITFHTKSGPLIARRAGDFITLDFPLNPTEKYSKQDVLPIIQEICDPALIVDVEYSATTKKLLIRLRDDASRETLEALRPDTRSLQASDTSDRIRGVIVTLRGTPDMVSSTGQPYDFVSRYFAPWNGIPEDPVTGSAHTVLADYWRKQLGKTDFFARQCSSRGGDLRVVIVDSRVELSGRARVVLSGKLAL